MTPQLSCSLFPWAWVKCIASCLYDLSSLKCRHLIDSKLTRHSHASLLLRVTVGQKWISLYIYTTVLALKPIYKKKPIYISRLWIPEEHGSICLVYHTMHVCSRKVSTYTGWEFEEFMCAMEKGEPCFHLNSIILHKLRNHSGSYFNLIQGHTRAQEAT